MEIDAGMLEWLVGERLAEARAHSARYALLRSVRAERKSVLVAAGATLIKIARRLGRRRAASQRGGPDGSARRLGAGSEQPAPAETG